MWFESTPLVADYPVQPLRRGRWHEWKRETLIRATFQLREFALGLAPAPLKLEIDPYAKFIDVHGRMHWKIRGATIPHESVLGVTGTYWQSTRTELNFFGNTAITRTELEDRSGDSIRHIIWSVTWRGGRAWTVLSSHASLAETTVWHGEDDDLQFASEIQE